jgi:hypothetical protein
LDNLASCFTREGQDEQAQDIDQRDGARSARKSSKVDHEIALQERPCGGKDAAGVKAESGSCGSDARRGKFPATKQRRPWPQPKADSSLRCAPLRVCDFFKLARKSGLKTKDLSSRKGPTNQKSHKLSE